MTRLLVAVCLAACGGGDSGMVDAGPPVGVGLRLTDPQGREQRICHVVPVAEGGFVFSGITGSLDEALWIWLGRVGESGDLLWEKRIATSSVSSCSTVAMQRDGRLVALDEDGHAVWVNLDGTDMHELLLQRTVRGAPATVGEVPIESRLLVPLDTAIMSLATSSSTGVVGWLTEGWFERILAAEDGAFVAVGKFGEDEIAARFDVDGNVVWQKRLRGAGTMPAAKALGGTIDAPIVVIGDWVAELDANGAVSWQTDLFWSGGQEFDTAVAVARAGSSVHLAGPVEGVGPWIVELTGTGGLVDSRVVDLKQGSAADARTRHMAIGGGGLVLVGDIGPDAWLLERADGGAVGCEPSFTPTLVAMPATEQPVDSTIVFEAGPKVGTPMPNSAESNYDRSTIAPLCIAP